MTTFPTPRLLPLLVVLSLALAACSRHDPSGADPGGVGAGIGNGGDTGGGGGTGPGPAPAAVAVTPASAEVAAGATVQFAATVGGAAGQVSWAVADAGGGTISADGVYTAPTAPGSYTVVATSAVDGTETASATVTVTAPPPDVADPRAFGAVGDGVTDDTAAFRAAAATGKVLVVSQPPAHYKITGTIQITSSIRGDGSLPEIRMYGTTGQESTAMLAIFNYAGPGLTVSGLHLNGGWDQVSANGEYSHNIMVKGSTNVTIEDNVLEAPEGDNVLLGGEWNPNPSRNVMIRNNQLLTPRRCAVALIWADGVTITGNTIRKPSSYVSAIDDEPSAGFETVWNVTITNNHFDTTAVAVMLYNMPYNSAPGGVGGNFTITGNRGTALYFFAQVNGGSTWVNINRSDNF